MKKNKKKDIEIEDELNEETVEKTEVVEEKEPTTEEIIAKLEKERNEAKDKWLRAMAEFENFRKRSISEKSNWIKNATERLVLEICDVFDNLERAIETGSEEHQFESFMKGVEMIYKQLDRVLEKEGVKKIESIGEQFDPEIHDALAQIPSEFEEDHVAAIIQNGYTMNDKVIRHVKVAVSNGNKPEVKE